MGTSNQGTFIYLLNVAISAVFNIDIKAYNNPYKVSQNDILYNSYVYVILPKSNSLRGGLWWAIKLVIFLVILAIATTTWINQYFLACISNCLYYLNSTQENRTHLMKSICSRVGASTFECAQVPVLSNCTQFQVQ